jgi:hypothetical protein
MKVEGIWRDLLNRLLISYLRSIYARYRSYYEGNILLYDKLDIIWHHIIVYDW